MPAHTPPQLNTTAARAGGQAAVMGASPAGAGLASWGLRDFTLYVTAFHNTVVYTSNATDGFVSACCVCCRMIGHLSPHTPRYLQ